MSEEKKVTNPYPGLRPFETNEYLLFFGREGQSDALVERLERSRFLAVVGTSGSGKSSLVRAGLLPALRGGMMSGAGAGWRIAVMRPGHDPVGNLARALSEANEEKRLEKESKEERRRREEAERQETGEQKRARLEREALGRAEAEAVIEATLRRGSLGLVEAAYASRLDEREKLLVVADQFEELFRFRAARAGAAATDDDAAAFVKLLLEAARQRELPVYVVLTMRSDFLGDCAQFQGLPEAINDGQYLIPRMSRDERRFAIVGPVRVARARMSEPLVNRLLNDVGDNPDQLPILQHALMRTWEHWTARRRDSEPIGLEHYEAVGTMSDALSRHADQAFNELPDDRSRHVAEILFKALTERGADNREIRRPTRLGDVCAIAEATPAEVAAVVEVFRREGRSFLMPPAGVPLTPDTVIDISHESLIRNWERLREWVRDEAESARIYRRLAGAAADYREGSGGLLDDVTLQYVLKWREKYNPNRAWGARYHLDFDAAIAYLEESRAARDARLAAEREREQRELEQARAFAEQQARANRKLRLLMVALAALLLLALATAAAAYAARKQAQANERVAIDLRDEANRQRERVASLLEGEKEEKQRARDAEAAAKKAEAAADEDRKRALIAEDEAEKQAERAEQQARLAAKHAADERRARKELAKQLERSEAIKEASRFFRHALTDMDRAQSNEEMADAYGRLFQSIKNFESVGDNDGAAAAYVTLGKFGGAIPENLSAVERAEKYLPKAVDYYLDDGNHLEAGETLESIADTLAQNMKGEEKQLGPRAIRRYEEAHAQFAAARSQAGIASVLRSMSAVYSDLGEKRKAVEALEKSIAVGRARLAHERQPKYQNLRGDLLTLVRLYHQAEPPARAEALADALIATVRADGDLADELNFLQELITVEGVGISTKLKYVERVREIARQLPSAARMEAESLRDIAGRIRDYERENIPEGGTTSDVNNRTAVEYYEAALKFFERAGANSEGAVRDVNSGEQVKILQGIGELHELAGRHREAAAAYERALSVRTDAEILSTPEVLRMYKRIVSFHVGAGELAQALAAERKLLGYLKSLSGEAYSDEVTEAERTIKDIEAKIERQRQPPAQPRP